MTTKTFIKKLCSRYVWQNLCLMALIVCALVFGTAWCTSLYTHHGEIIKVPDIRNKKFADAEQLLESAGLQIVVTDTGYNRHLPPDCILQQMPLPGQEVKSGRIIYVTINASEKPTLTLPDIVDNSSEREALAKLKILGFKIGDTMYVPGEKGWVYGVVCRGKRLVAGDKVPVDAMIILQVGSGQLDANDSLEVTDPIYQPDPEDDMEEIHVETSHEEDPFQEIVVE